MFPLQLSPKKGDRQVTALKKLCHPRTGPLLSGYPPGRRGGSVKEIIEARKYYFTIFLQ